MRELQVGPALFRDAEGVCSVGVQLTSNVWTYSHFLDHHQIKVLWHNSIKLIALVITKTIFMCL